MTMIRFTEPIAARRKGESAEFDEESAALLVAQRVAEYVDDTAAGVNAEPDDESDDQNPQADTQPTGRNRRR